LILFDYCVLFYYCGKDANSFGSLTLLYLHKEEHLTCKVLFQQFLPRDAAMLALS